MTRTQKLVSTDGVSIDIAEAAENAKRKVERTSDGTPIHACSKASHRDCPCWTCTYDGCAACIASLY